MNNATVHCCADCGGVAGGGVSLKACKSCMLVKYCNADCQKNHWPTHKKECKRRAAELHDEVLFKDPPAKKDCPICFLPMPQQMINCISLPPATILSVPIYYFSIANEELSEKLAGKAIEVYYSCCGKSTCTGCVHSFCESGNDGKCPFCKAEQDSKTDEEIFDDFMKRVEVNDAGATFALGSCYRLGQLGLQQNREKAVELWTRAANFGCSKALFFLGYEYGQRGDLKKAKSTGRPRLCQDMKGQDTT